MLSWKRPTKGNFAMILDWDACAALVDLEPGCLYIIKEGK